MDNYMIILIAIGLGCFITIIFMRVMIMFNKDHSNSESSSPRTQYSDYVNKQYNGSIEDLHRQANKVFNTIDDIPDFDEACIEYMEIIDAEEVHDDKQIN